MQARTRHILLAVALSSTLAVIAWLDTNEAPSDEVVAVARHSVRLVAPENAATTVNAPVQSEAIAQSPDEEIQDLFMTHSWYVAPPPAPKALRPVVAPKPVAPPVPYSYLGQVEQEGRTMFFLFKANRLYSVAAGDVLDGAYRVEGGAAGKVDLTYLPLNIKQTVILKGAS